MLPTSEQLQLGQLLTNADRRWKTARAVLVALGAITILSGLAAAFAGLVLLIFIGPGLFSPTEPRFVAICVALAYAAFYLAPFLVLLPLLVPLSIRWRDPARIVVLRKFNDRRVSRALQGLISRHLARHGHVFTLADSSFKVPLYVRIPLLFGQLSFFHFRPRKIRDARGLDRLRELFTRRTWLNLNWFVSRGKSFAVAASDAMWKDCLRAALESATLVIMDVSRPSAALEWESEECARLGRTHALIAVVAREQLDRGREWQQRIANSGGVTPPLVVYDERGQVEDVAGLRRAAAAIVAGGLAAASTASSSDSLGRLLGRLAKMSVALAGGAAVLLFPFAPYLFPGITAARSPFPSQVLEAYLTHRVPLALERMKREWPEESLALVLRQARVHRFDYCPRVADALTALADASATDELIALAQEGEPMIAGAAADALLRLDARDLSSRVAPWLESRRLDVRRNAVRILKNTSAAQGTTAAILASIARAPSDVHPEPPRHQDDGLGIYGLVDALSVQFSTEQDLDRFYSEELDPYLETTLQAKDRDQIALALSSSGNPRSRIVLAFALMRLGDLRGRQDTLLAVSLERECPKGGLLSMAKDGPCRPYAFQARRVLRAAGIAEEARPGE